MIVALADISIKAEKAAEFERVVRELEAAVRANEPGCLLYRLAKSRADPLSYKTIEVFRDQAAIDAHVAADYFQAALPLMRACVSAPSQVEFLDTVD